MAVFYTDLLDKHTSISANTMFLHRYIQTLKITSFPILHMLSFIFICLQAQMREHRCVSFLIIQNRKIGNGHVAQYGFEFLSLYILFNVSEPQALCSPCSLCHHCVF